MIPEYWQRQTTDKPLFPDILWSRPESKQAAGKLLVIGGNSHGFSAVGEAYMSASSAGAGSVRALLPNKLQKIMGNILENCEFAPSTPSGSFGKDALNEFLISAGWADGVLLAGDIGRNSETAILLESFIQKYTGQLTITKDAVDYFYSQPELVANRHQTTLVLSLGQLQKLGTALKFEVPFLLSMGMMLLVQALHELTLRYPFTLVTKELDQLVVAHNGQVTSTKLTEDKDIWRVSTAAKTSVFWLQNPQKTLESITASLASQ